MKTRTRANTKVAPKVVQPKLQTTLARQSISQDLPQSQAKTASSTGG